MSPPTACQVWLEPPASWLARFEDEDQCLAALNRVRGASCDGVEVKARVRAEDLLRPLSKSSATAPQAAATAPLAAAASTCSDAATQSSPPAADEATPVPGSDADAAITAAGGSQQPPSDEGVPCEEPSAGAECGGFEGAGAAAHGDVHGDGAYSTYSAPPFFGWMPSHAYDENGNAAVTEAHARWLAMAHAQGQAHYPPGHGPQHYARQAYYCAEFGMHYGAQYGADYGFNYGADYGVEYGADYGHMYAGAQHVYGGQGHYPVHGPPPQYGEYGEHGGYWPPADHAQRHAENGGEGKAGRAPKPVRNHRKAGREQGVGSGGASGGGSGGSSCRACRAAAGGSAAQEGTRSSQHALGSGG